MNIKLVTALDVRDGYGYVGQSIALALDKLGHSVWVDPVSVWHSESQLNPRVKELMRKLNSVDFTLYIMYPVYNFGQLAKPSAIITMYEAHRCPFEWVKKLNGMGIPIFAPSKFVKTMFEDSGVTVPIHHLQLGVDQELYSRNSRRVSPEETFRFLTMGKMEPRKNSKVTVECFQEAFKNGENVELIIKTRERFLPLEVKIAANHDSRIKIIEKTITEDELVKVYNYCHCFIYPSRGEGFSFPPRNAIANGMPTMVTNWSALEEIPGAIKIPITGLTAMPPCGFSYGEHDKMHMANIDIGCLIGYMQDLYNSPYLYDLWAKDTYETKQDTWEDCANNLVGLIKDGL